MSLIQIVYLYPVGSCEREGYMRHISYVLFLNALNTRDEIRRRPESYTAKCYTCYTDRLRASKSIQEKQTHGIHRETYF